MKKISFVLLAVTVTFNMASPSSYASSAEEAVNVVEAKVDAAQKSQQKIDVLAEQTNDLFRDYKTVTKQIDGLRVYNQRLEKQINNQLARVNEIETSIEQVTTIQRQVLPLVIRMIDSLEQFVNLDVPFLLEERKERLAFLRAGLDRSDISVAEKFRQVMEAYKIENEYGRTLETYKGSVSIDGVEREVNFLRVGRVALLYQTTDADVSGAWDKTANGFVELDKADYRNAIQKGLRIARKQASIEVLKLPMTAPEAAL